MSTAPLRQEFEDLIRRDLLGPAGGEQEAIGRPSLLAPLR